VLLFFMVIKASASFTSRDPFIASTITGIHWHSKFFRDAIGRAPIDF